MKEDEGSDHHRRAIIEAEIHCHRAIYDAMEVGIIHYWRAIELFSKDYRTTIITEILSDYSERVAEVTAIIEEIGATEDRNSPKERAEKHEQIQRQFDCVQDTARYFLAARGELNKAKKRQLKERMILVLKIFSLILGIIVIALGLISLPPWRQDGSQGRTPELPGQNQPVETDTTDSSTSVDTTIQ